MERGPPRSRGFLQERSQLAHFPCKINEWRRKEEIFSIGLLQNNGAQSDVEDFWSYLSVDVSVNTLVCRIFPQQQRWPIPSSIHPSGNRLSRVFQMSLLQHSFPVPPWRISNHSQACWDAWSFLLLAEPAGKISTRSHPGDNKNRCQKHFCWLSSNWRSSFSVPWSVGKEKILQHAYI